jgi:hypothetical protein
MHFRVRRLLSGSAGLHFFSVLRHPTGNMDAADRMSLDIPRFILFHLASKPNRAKTRASTTSREEHRNTLTLILLTWIMPEDGRWDLIQRLKG